MAKLTLSFKGHPIDAFHLEKGGLLVGRAPDCDVVIDSLAVAPHHAQIVQEEDGCYLLAIDPALPVFLNQEAVEEAEIHHGDEIGIGKHALLFAEDAVQLAPMSELEEDDPFPDHRLEPVLEGYLQILNGSNLGRIIPLQSSLTRLGRPGRQSAVIAHKDNDFFLSHLEGDEHPKVGGVAIDDQPYPLLHGEVIEIGGIRMRFFADEAQGLDAAREG